MECQNAQKINMNNKSLALQRSYKVRGVIDPGLFVHICTAAEENVFCVWSVLSLVLLHQDRLVREAG
jgi:hypothetical protein